MAKYRFVENQFSKIFEKIPQKWYWTFGLAMGIIFTFTTYYNSPLYSTSQDAEKIILFGIITSLFSILFTGFALMVVIPFILLIVLAPMIQNKIKEVKTLYFDYPRVVHDKSFNENPEVVDRYLRIVFKEELDLIRKTVISEVRDEIKKSTTLANKGHQDHETRISNLENEKTESEQITTEKIHVQNQSDDDTKS